MYDPWLTFWSRVKVEGDCWLWTKHLDEDGYGKYSSRILRARHRTNRAHVLAWLHMRGDLPDGLVLDHLCKRRSCVNPYHLDPVTHAVNNSRGSSWSAVNARKTHCKHGHEFNKVNTRVHKGKRYCRVCQRIRAKERYAVTSQ